MELRQGPRPGIIEFLHARIDDEERAARSAAEAHPPAGWSIAWYEETMHSARHDPARVLVECDAKRRMIAELARISNEHGANVARPIKILALPYADHPDYRDEWRP